MKCPTAKGHPHQAAVNTYSIYYTLDRQAGREENVRALHEAEQGEMNSTQAHMQSPTELL